MLRVIPLQGFRVKKEKQASVPRLRLRDEPFTAPVADKESQGPPRVYLVSRKYERLPSKDVDPPSEKVTNIFKYKRGGNNSEK